MDFTKGLNALLAAVVISVVTPSAHGGIVFDYSGTCSLGCSEVGLSVGGAISGTIEVATAAAVPNGVLADSDIEAFAFGFGTYSLSSLNAALIVLNGSALFDASADSIIGTGQLQFRSLPSFAFVAAIDLVNGAWLAAPPPDFNSAHGAGSITRHQVPEPAGAMLVGAGILALLARRRYQIRSSERVSVSVGGPTHRFWQS